MARDYYDVLGVDRNADARTIKRAFLDKARELHPDVSDDPDAESKFKEVNEAYSVLSDANKRANYDRFGSADGPMGGFDVSDIFGGGLDDIFSSFFGGGAASAQAQRVRTRGRDMGIRLTISLAEAAAGCTKTVAYDRMATCESCNGTGTAEGGSVDTCPTCHGSGRVTTYQRTILGAMQTQSACPDCGGLGQKVTNPCPACHGDGRVRAHEKVSVDIPAGVMDGMRLTVPGKGEAGLRGDASGDLFVQVFVEADERFERDGDDLWSQCEISAFDAMLGCTVPMAGIMEDELIEVQIPAGTQPGDRVSVSGAGMPRTGGSGRGRLIVVVGVTIPTDLTGEERRVLSGLAEAHRAAHAEAAEASQPENNDRETVRQAEDAVSETVSDDSGRKRSKRPRKRGRK